MKENKASILLTFFPWCFQKQKNNTNIMQNNIKPLTRNGHKLYGKLNIHPPLNTCTSHSIVNNIFRLHFLIYSLNIFFRSWKQNNRLISCPKKKLWVKQIVNLSLSCTKHSKMRSIFTCLWSPV